MGKTDVNIDQREKDIQAMCSRIIETSPTNTGDYGSGAECPFCYEPAHHFAGDLTGVNHKFNCIYLIAKDLSTNMVNQ